MKGRKYLVLAMCCLFGLIGCQSQNSVVPPQSIGVYGVSFNGKMWLAGPQSKERLLLADGKRSEMWYVLDFLERRPEFRQSVDRIRVAYDNGSLRDFIFLENVTGQVQFVLAYDSNQESPLTAVSSVVQFDRAE